MNLLKEVKFASREEVNEFIVECKNNYNLIAGLDEVGRGCLFAGVVVACVILPPEHGIVGIRDSKRLTPQRRGRLAGEISTLALTYGIGTASNEEIDQINIANATLLAAGRAIKNCAIAPDLIISDGGLDLSKQTNIPFVSIIKGDDLVECVGAASIMAKVFRDHQMDLYHEIYPEYGLNGNRGYGTQDHLEAIKQRGITKLHRRSFGICKTAKLCEESNGESKGQH